MKYLLIFLAFLLLIRPIGKFLLGYIIKRTVEKNFPNAGRSHQQEYEEGHVEIKDSPDHDDGFTDFEEMN